jgi:predicted glutamine amidotransferase
MCQLLGMNSNVPTDICFSFTGFKARGGATDRHADGWGVAFFEGKGVRMFHDPQPCSTSPLANLVSTHPIRSTSVIAHIRKATHGEISLENTHPFQRELWGRYWAFAHNGTLTDFRPELNGVFRPVGTTDSELAFCWLMQELMDMFGEDQPSRINLFNWLHRFTLDISRFGVVNFLLSNGDYLFAHSSTRLSYLVRQAPFAKAHLIDEDLTADLGASTDPATRAVVIATTPLTDNEPWIQMPAGSLWCFGGGQLLSNSVTVPGVDRRAGGNCD